MSPSHAPTPAEPQASAGQPDATTLWFHAAFCEMGLPMRAGRGNWQREVGPLSLRVEPASAEQVVPSGRLLRLCLMEICDAAFRADSVVLELGDRPADFAARMGLGVKTTELVEQMHRILAAKITVTWGGAEFTVFDARSRSRADLPEWRPSLRLGTRFLAGLTQNPVALDRRVVRQLADSPMALDAYAWIRLTLRSVPAERIRTTSWEELLRRFGAPSHQVASFRPLFEAALRLVFEADRSIALAVDDEGVSVRHAGPEDDEPGAESVAAPPEPAPPAPATPQPLKAEAPQPEAAPPAPEARPVPPRPQPRPPEPVPTPAPRAPEPAAAEARPPAEDAAATPADVITQDRICLPRASTGLSQGIWLRRGHGAENVLIGVTPSPRFEPDKLTVLAVEPIVLQVSGGLYQQDFERVSAWIMANRDLVDDFWDGRITSFQEINRRIRKAPAPGWR